MNTLTLMTKNLKQSLLLLAFVLVTFFVKWQAAGSIDEKIHKHLIRVNVSQQAFNFIKPWEKLEPRHNSGLGVMLKNRKILVSASLVRNSNYVEFESPQSGKKQAAEITQIDYEANLALLSESDDNLETDVQNGRAEQTEAESKEAKNFLEDYEGLDLEHDVKIGDEVNVWQIDNNGDFLRTVVRISRFDVRSVGSGASSYLVYEAKGSLQDRVASFIVPVTKDGKFIGLIYTYNSNSQLSYIIPSPNIKLFIDDATDGNYEGFPSLGSSFSPTLDEQFRRFLKIEDREGGIFVNKLIPNSSASASDLQVGDVVMKINGYEVDSKGYFKDERYGKISIAHLFKNKVKVGEVIPIEIVRDGESKTIDVKMKHKKVWEYVVPHYMHDRPPNFLIYGGAVFQELSMPYMYSVWGGNWRSRAPLNFIEAFANEEDLVEEKLDRLVILSIILPSKATHGYGGYRNLIVNKINGVKPRNLAEFKASLENNSGNIQVLEFGDDDGVIYLDDEECKKSNQNLQKTYNFKELEHIEYTNSPLTDKLSAKK